MDIKGGLDATGKIAGPGVGQSVKSWFDNMPDYMKYSLLTTAGQGASGLASGYFQGLSADQQLELQKLIAERNESQRQFGNRNASYAPSIGFKKPGMVGAVGGTA
jgi:hypothetical protein